MRSTIAMMPVSLLLAACLTVAAWAGDYWKSFDEPGVATNNDCGFVSAVAGTPLIKRSFMPAKEEGLPAYMADRLNAGDTVIVPPGGRLEISGGKNIIMVVGPGSRLKLMGLRNIAGVGGVPVARLDVQLETGDMRAQVRLNDERPEAVLAMVGGADILLTRGDVGVFAAAAWRATGISGTAAARVRRGPVAGAPFEFDAGVSVSGAGQNRIENAELLAIRAKLPFSFEQVQAALPPRPALGSNMEAP